MTSPLMTRHSAECIPSHHFLTVRIFDVEAMFIIVPIIIILSSVLAIISPRTAWYLQEGWKYKNVEPSDAALAMVRISGVFGVIAGIAFIIMSQTMFAERPAGFR